MADLFNQQTRLIENIEDEDQLNEAIASGTHTFKKGSEVYAYSPSGEKVYIPASQAKDAIGQGFRIKPKIKEAADEWASEQGIKGTVNTAIGQFFDETLMGIPEMVADKTQTPLDRAKRESLKELNPIANTIGGVAGFATSIGYGAPLFKGASKAGELATKGLLQATGKLSEKAAESFVAKAAAKGAGGALEGALSVSPIAVAQAALGDGEDAAETLMFGGALGGVFGAGGELSRATKKLATENSIVKNFIEEGKQKLAQSKDLQGVADEFAFRTLNPTVSKQKKLIVQEEIVDELENLVGVKVSNDGKVLGRFLRDEGILDGLPSGQKILDRVAEAESKYMDQVSSLIKRADETYGDAIAVSKDEIAEATLKRIENSPKLMAEVNKPFRAQFGNFLKSFRKEADQLAPDLMSYERANLEKAQIQERIKNSFASGEVNKKAYFNEMQRAINETIRDKLASVDPKLAEELRRAQVKLGNSKAAKILAEDNAARLNKNNMIGMNSFLSAIAGAAAGAPGGAELALTLGAGAGALREVARRYGDNIISKAAANLSGAELAQKMMRKTAKRLDEIPAVLRRMSTGERKPVKAYGVNAATRLFALPEVEGKTSEPEKIKALKKMPTIRKWEEIKKAREKIIRAQLEPGKMAERLAQITEPLKDGGAEVVASALSKKMGLALSYLEQHVPKDPAPNTMFAKSIPYTPSDAEMNSFLERVKIVNDPFSAISELEAGTLSPEHVETLEVLYPRLLQAMTDKVFEASRSGEITLPYSDRVNLSILLRAPIDETMADIPYYQGVFSKRDPNDSEIEGVGPALPSPGGFSASVDLSKNVMTQSQKALM